VTLVVSLNTIFLLFVLAICGGGALYLLFNNHRSEASRYLSYLLLTAVGWLLSALLYTNFAWLEWSLLLKELVLSFFVSYWPYFLLLIPTERKLPTYWQKALFFIVGLFIGGFSLLSGWTWLLRLYALAIFLISLLFLWRRWPKGGSEARKKFFSEMVGVNWRSLGIIYIFGAIMAVGTLTLLYIGQPRFLLSFYIVLANLVLGLLVLLQNPRSKINSSFFLIALGIILWTIGVYMFWNLTDVRLTLFGGRLAFFGATLIPAFLLFFILVFPKQLKAINALQWLAIVTPVVVFTFLIMTGQILEEVIFVNGGIERIYGAAYPFFSIYYLLYLPLSFYDLFRKERTLVGFNRIQVRYIFLAFGLSSLIAVTTNLILPSFGVGTLSFIGPHATLILVGMIAYAILKHRLLSVEVVIQKSTVYGTATIMIMAFYALSVMISEVYLREIFGYTSLVITALAALLIAVIYQPLVKWFQLLTDRLFFRGRYDYQTTLRQISQQIASVIRLEELSQLIVNSFVETMKVSEISFLLIDKDQEHFRSIPLVVPHYKNIEIDTSSAIINWLATAKDILVRDEIEDELNRPGTWRDRRVNLNEVREEMVRLGINVWVPIISKEKLIGIIALGNKLSGDIFTAEDIGLLGTLANQTAVALDNARLYDEMVEVKNYNEKILQSMVNGVLTVDNHGRIITFNQMATKISGRPAVEVLGKTCAEIWGKRGVLTTVIDNLLEQGKVYKDFQSGIASPDRGLVPVSLSSTLLYDHLGKKIGALLTIQDITEVKELEDKVRQADKLAALATMAAGMAHEIKNPLSSMKVLSQLLPKKIDDPEYRNKIGEIFPREINRIDRIVESLLGFARATALTFEPADLNTILEDNVKYFTDQAAANEIVIKTNYASLPPVEVDKAQITQVFSNLMLNAIQAIKNGGELKVETALIKDQEGNARQVRIKIADTGHGIPEETLKKLFDPFFTTKYGGTGLGLTISHSIVDGHKGYIGVESVVGKGTIFTVTLPVSQALL
jgi:PAS domain S-box-containing protein